MLEIVDFTRFQGIATVFLTMYRYRKAWDRERKRKCK